MKLRYPDQYSGFFHMAQITGRKNRLNPGKRHLNSKIDEMIKSNI
jgi:hypothetical protein